MKKHDRVLYSALAVVFLLSSAASAWAILTGRQLGGVVLEVQVDGVVVDRIALSEPRGEGIEEIRTVSGDRGFNAFETGPDGVRMVSSDCRGGDCLSMPPVKAPGTVIVCLPHKLILRLVGKLPERGAVDVVSY